jgi:hypothetical protein
MTKALVIVSALAVLTALAALTVMVTMLLSVPVRADTTQYIKCTWSLIGPSDKPLTSNDLHYATVDCHTD